MLKESKRTNEKEINVIVASDSFKDIYFVENNKVVSFPQQERLETVTENMKKRLINCDSLISKSNEQNDKFYDLINLLDPNCWNIDEVVVPWLAAEDKLRKFSKVFHHEISINEFWDYVRMSCKILATLQRLRFLQMYRKLRILSMLLLLVLQRQKESFQK